MRNTAVFAALMACVASAPLAAKEGMFTPGQLPEIADDLRAMGLEVSPEKLSDLTGFPLRGHFRFALLPLHHFNLGASHAPTSPELGRELPFHPIRVPRQTQGGGFAL